MKTKRFFTLLGCLVSLLLVGCTKPNPNHGQVAGETEGDSLFTNIVIPTTMGVEEAILSPKPTEDGKSRFYARTGMLIWISGNAYNSRYEAHRAKFRAMAEALGDFPIKGGYVHATPVTNCVLSSSI